MKRNAMKRLFALMVLFLCLQTAVPAQSNVESYFTQSNCYDYLKQEGVRKVFVDFLNKKITQEQLGEQLTGLGVKKDDVPRIVGLSLVLLYGDKKISPEEFKRRFCAVTKMDSTEVQKFIDEQNQPSAGKKTEEKEEPWPNLPGHKTYEGPFEAFGLFEQYGKAKYQYIQKADGTRAFDGRFKYRAGDFIATGQFKNDYQTGRWEFTDGKKTSVINFNASGAPDGAFEAYDYHLDDIKYEDGTRAGRVVMSQTKYCGTMDRGNITEIDFITSTGHHPAVIYNQENATRVYMKSSNNIKYTRSRGWYLVDEKTGTSRSLTDSQIGVESGLSSFPVNTLSSTKLALRHYLLRSTMREYYKMF